MNIDIVGEDDVTKSIAARLITEYRPDLIIKTIHPVRGSQIKGQAPIFNRLNSPILLLADQDDIACAPAVLTDWLGDTPLNSQMLFRVAQTEAEVWLMADREGFANWLSIPRRMVPEPIEVARCRDGRRLIELPFPYKPSLYMMRELAVHSRNSVLKDQLTPGLRASKGPAYNTAVLPFIATIWNPERARVASSSLDKAITRLQEAYQ